MPEADIVLERGGTDFLYGSVSDTSCRIVDNSPKSLLVVRIGDKSEICHNVLDFLTLEEALPSEYPVRHVLFPQLLLEAPAQGVGPIQYGEVGICHAVLPYLFPNIVAYHHGFLLVGISLSDDNLFSFLVFAIYILGYLPAVVLHEAVGSLHDVLRRPVVALELEQLSVRILALKVEDVVDIGTAEGVNALIVIANHADIMVFACQQ